jgi:hypothetical protein
MFYSTSDGQYIQEGTQFVVDGVTYPPQWLNQATEEQKAEIGLEEVVATNSPANDQYYWVSTELDKATLTYINNPKDLDTVKENSITQVNQTAYSLLFPSDWMVVKAVETATPIPNDWNTWRQSIRQLAADTKVQIIAATDVDQVASIMGSIQWPFSPNEVVVYEES